MTAYVSDVHNRSLAGATDNSKDAYCIPGCPEWESNPHFTGFESALSTWLEYRGLARHRGSEMTIYLITVRSWA